MTQSLRRRLTAPGRAFLAAVAVSATLFPCAGSAQRRKPAVTPVAAPAGWDSLYRTGRLFELRDTVIKWTGAQTPATQVYRGIVAEAFNENDAAILLLAPIMDSAPRSLPQRDLVSATWALGKSYTRLFRYSEAAAAFGKGIAAGGKSMDSATLSRMRSLETISSALRAQPPQRVRWKSASNGAQVPNGGAPFAIDARIGEDQTTTSFAIDPNLSLSVMDSTTASRHALKLLGGPVSVTFRGARLTGKIATIDDLDFGFVSVTNAAVIVVDDAVFASAGMSGSTHGVLGLPVLASLGSVTLTVDGQVRISSPGSDADTASVPSFALGDDAVQLSTVVDGRRALMILDLSAPTTVLYPEFLRAFPSIARDAKLTSIVGTTATGRLGAVPAYALSSFGLTVGTRPFQFITVNVLMRDPRAVPDGVVGAMGQDAIRAGNRMTLDFAAMTVRFRDRAQPSVLPQIVYPTVTHDAQTPLGKVPEDIAFVALIFALFVIPKALQRYRLPSAITSLFMGAGATAFGLFHHDPTLHLLSTFGIVALFLFAGLEIDGAELRRQARPLVVHGLSWFALLAIGSIVATYAFGFALRPGVLIALALLTPSTGFILSSLAGLGLREPERFTVKTYAIASEILALVVLFFILQSTSLGRLAIALGAMLAVVIVIPLAFKLFARIVAPHAPRSEFAFLLMVAIVCAYATRRLGVYYLVGAFLVGIAAQRFRTELPAMSSEKMVDALESFGSVFIPFYFFRAGTEIVREQLSLRALGIGAALIAVMIPLRVAITVLQRRFGVGERSAAATRIGVALVPTLVFTLVLTDILNTDFGTSSYVLGALVLYTVVNTTIPAFVLKSAPPEFEHVEATELEGRTS